MRKTILYKKGFSNLLFVVALVFVAILCVDLINDKNWAGVIPLVFLGYISLRYHLLSPQSVYLVRNKIVEKYLFQEKSFNASDIESININSRGSNFGRGPRAHSFVDILTSSGYTISIEYFRNQAPDIYEILQGWHKKHTSKTRQTSGPN